MYQKAITYEDYNGVKKTKNFYFNLTRSEIAKMHLMTDGGLDQMIKKMIESGSNKEIFTYFENFVLSCYGEKSADGEEFIKNEEIREKFRNHTAYDVLFMELISNSKSMADFINAIVPAEVSEGAKNNKRTINDVMGYEVIPEEGTPNITPVK
jgi:hypothetical protein